MAIALSAVGAIRMWCARTWGWVLLRSWLESLGSTRILKGMTDRLKDESILRSSPVSEGCDSCVLDMYSFNWERSRTIRLRTIKVNPIIFTVSEDPLFSTRKGRLMNCGPEEEEKVNGSSIPSFLRESLVLLWAFKRTE